MTMLVENIRMAVTSLLANKSRALLTMLGIIIGIASVIAIMTVGNSLTVSVSTSMQSLGANNITVNITKRDSETVEKENGIIFGELERSKTMSESDYITDEMIQNVREDNFKRGLVRNVLNQLSPSSITYEQAVKIKEILDNGK